MQAHGAVIIGGGILAVDLAYALRQRGIAVTLALREDTVGAPLFAPEVGYFTARRMLADGIQMIPQVTVAEYLSDDLFALSGVRLSNGETLPCAVAISAIGVHPNTELAAEAGIALDEISAAIVVNEHMATNSPAVYAAGNCAQYQQHSARHWEDAREQGRVAALNMLGQPTVYAPTISGNLATLFYDVPCAYFGQTSGAEQWTQHTAHDFVQVTLEQGRLVGATLLGNIAGAIHDLVAKQHQPLTSAELEAWWQTRSVVETA
jgi:NADPH-dependent 2,4-dienoyl-CoA reductase/sulfur reductase-like enzyme